MDPGQCWLETSTCSLSHGGGAFGTQKRKVGGNREKAGGNRKGRW